METTHCLNRTELAKRFDAGDPQPLPTTTPKRNSVSLSETAPFWFAVASPLIGLLIGFLGAWFVTWLTSQ
jgi:hypothetical protein